MSQRLSVAVLVQRANGQILWTERKRSPGLWALPGGKVEPGERPLEAAVRELGEETGRRLRPEQLLQHAGPVDDGHGHDCALFVAPEVCPADFEPTPGPGEARCLWGPLALVYSSALHPFSAAIVSMLGNRPPPPAHEIRAAEAWIRAVGSPERDRVVPR